MAAEPVPVALMSPLEVICTAPLVLSASMPLEASPIVVILLVELTVTSLLP